MYRWDLLERSTSNICGKIDIIMHTLNMDRDALVRGQNFLDFLSMVTDLSHGAVESSHVQTYKDRIHVWKYFKMRNLIASMVLKKKIGKRMVRREILGLRKWRKKGRLAMKADMLIAIHVKTKIPFPPRVAHLALNLSANNSAIFRSKWNPPKCSSHALPLTSNCYRQRMTRGKKISKSQRWSYNHFKPASGWSKDYLPNFLVVLPLGIWCVSHNGDLVVQENEKSKVRRDDPNIPMNCWLSYFVFGVVIMKIKQ